MLASRRFLVIPAVAAIFVLPLVVTGARPTAAATEARITLPGLRRPVEILVDRWGIAHIYAETEQDLFYAQGWNAARDRLFQLELWRRQATGTVAEILGPRELERDIGTRLFMFRRDMGRELAHYHPRGAEIVGAFVRGINAYIDEANRRPDSLPIEFRLLGIRPQHWTPEVVISRHQGLLGNIGQELSVGRAVAALGPERVKFLESFGPGDPNLALDPLIDSAALAPDILALYNAFRGSLRFRAEDIVPEHRRRAGALERLQSATTLSPATPSRSTQHASRLEAAPSRSAQQESRIAVAPSRSTQHAAGNAVDLSTDEEQDARLSGPTWRDGIGSNNWVVSGRLSESGWPMMANDPHRAQSAPSLRYWVHLVAPGWNVIGGGEPTLPGVSIGHNEHGAWGLTIFATDGEDLYVYETNPRNPNQYRYRGQWQDMTVIRETIAVKGAPAHTVELRYTRHGPVVHRDTIRHRAYAVRAAWMEIGGAPYLASLRMNQARTWQEFREACAFSNIPGENMVWADTGGTIGWQSVGIAPVRRTWSGLVPVPGDGRFEWDGFLPILDKPHVANPPEGFFATANNDLIPRDYPHMDAIGFSWSDPYRWARINEVLASGRRHSVADMMRLQTDELSIPARQLVPLLRHLGASEARVEAARRRLVDWDYVLDRESVEAGIYVEWESQLRRGVLERMVTQRERAHVRSLPLSKVIAWLVAPPGELGARPVAARDSILLATLSSSVAELTQRFGARMDDWAYGRPGYKHALIRHPLSGVVSDALRARLEVGPLPRGGYGNTPNATGGGDNQTSGASFRIVVDVGDWDRAVGTNTPGQSGDPASPHYRDLFEMWATDRFFPVFYSRDRVEAVTERRLALEPAGGEP